jgi:hypothetical protein
MLIRLGEYTVFCNYFRASHEALQIMMLCGIIYYSSFFSKHASMRG